MGLIHRQRHQLAALQHVIEQLTGGFPLQSLRGQIKQPQPVVAQPLQQLAPLRQSQTAMDAGRRDAAALQLAHLVLHQSNQR